MIWLRRSERLVLFLMLASKKKNPLDEFRAFALDNPQWFFRDFLNFPLLPWQLEFINAVLDVPRLAMGLKTKVNHEGKKRVTARSCHGTGKTQAMASLIHIWNFCFYGKVAATAPKEDQLLRRLLPRYRTILKGAPEAYQLLINVKGREVDIAGDRDYGLACETASDPDNLAGYHDTPQLFVIDEASSRRLDPMFSVIEGALTTPGSAMAEIGNPTRMEGEFFQHHNRTDLAGIYYRMHVKYTDAKSLIGEDWVKTMRLKYGENSPVFKIRVLGEFADFDSAILIPLEFIEDAYDNDLQPDGSLPKLRVSVDVADGGADATVITVGYRYADHDHIVQQKSFNFDPSVAVIESANAAITLFEAHGGKKNTQDDIVVDANGVGAGTAGKLIKSGYNVIRHVGGSCDGVDKTRYKNRRAKNHIAMYDRFAEGKVKIDSKGLEDKEKFERHILAVKRDSDGDDSKDEIMTADKVKAELGESPDCSASLSMFFYGDRAHIIQATTENIITTQSSVAYEQF